MIDVDARHESAHCILAFASGFKVERVQLEPEACSLIRFPLEPKTFPLFWQSDNTKTLQQLSAIVGVLKIGNHVDGRRGYAGDDGQQINIWREAYAALKPRASMSWYMLEARVERGIKVWACNPTNVDAIEWLAQVLERQRVLSGLQLQAFFSAYVGQRGSSPIRPPQYVLPASVPTEAAEPLRFGTYFTTRQR
jgi:hypothetical protein